MLLQLDLTEIPEYDSQSTAATGSPANGRRLESSRFAGLYPRSKGGNILEGVGGSK